MRRPSFCWRNRPCRCSMPPWAIRLVLPVPELERAVHQAVEDDGLDLDELPQL